jgi:hypothetical protein
MVGRFDGLSGEFLGAEQAAAMLELTATENDKEPASHLQAFSPDGVAGHMQLAP